MTSMREFGRRHGAVLGAIAGACALAVASAGARAQVKDSYDLFEKMGLLTTDPNGGGSYLGSPPVSFSSGSLLLGFDGPSQYNAASFGRNFIPPDTMGAVGKTQYVATTNGAYAVYNKSGSLLSMTSDVAFWAAAGQTGAFGDTRIMYNATASRWVAVSFGANVSDLQIAVSNSDDAMGTWKSVKYSGYNPAAFGGVADYPTLALDKNAVYIGTNNFKCLDALCNGANFKGTTLNVIPTDSLFNAIAPTVANMKQFVTPNTADRGFAIQGVNSETAGSTGKIVANSAFYTDNMTYKVNGLTTSSATGATLGENTYLGVTNLTDPSAARQPAVTVPGNARVIDALDQRIGSSVYESKGKIFMVQSVDGGDMNAAATGYARVRYTVIDSNTNAILDQGDIGSGQYDYYQGSIAVNSAGQVVIGYDRSGSGPTDGKISFMASTYMVGADGKLHSTGGELLLKTSVVDDYHNGSADGLNAADRQRWGDYSQVSIDPTDQSKFWLIGEYALGYNDAAYGHPTGTGGSRWGTYIAEINAPIPEPSTYMMMVFGLAAVGGIGRRRRRND